MMVPIGNFLFKYRNLLFPVVFVLMLFGGMWPCTENDRIETWLIVIGLLLALSGQALRAVTIGLAYIKRGGKDKKVFAATLVTQGIFAHCRNPLYVGNILIATGVGVASNSMPFIVLGIPFFLFAYRAIVAAEEQYLQARFGQEFTDYCRRVNRFFVDLRGIGQTWRSMDFHWRRLLVKEYQTPFLWMTGFLLLVMKSEYLEWGYRGSKHTLWLLSSGVVCLLAAFFLAWGLKKAKVVRAD